MADAEALLAGYVPLSKQITGKDLTLARMVPLMAAVGNPERKLRIVHVAGTSGKTSTAYYIAALLEASGKKVGLTVSPHVDSVRERVQVGGQPLTEQQFVAGLSEFIDLIEGAGLQPTYFELLVAFAYWYFKRAGVDYAVIETGMGGWQDGTNIAQNNDKLCIITDIGMDHMHVLGNTIAEIARQKAGIIWPGNTAIMHRQDEEVLGVVSDWCNEHEADLRVLEPDEIAQGKLDVHALPEFQARNAQLAYAALEWLAQRDGLAMPGKSELHEALSIQVPGRMDKVKVNGLTIVMDGAHNEQKTEAFVSSFKKMYPGRKVPVLLSLKQGKEFAAVLPLLKPITSVLVLTVFNGTQDLPAVAISPEVLASAAKYLGYTEVIVESNQDRALHLLEERAEGLCVITGSFYLLGQLRANHPELRRG